MARNPRRLSDTEARKMDKTRCRYSDCKEGHPVVRKEEPVSCPTCREWLGLPLLPEPALKKFRVVGSVLISAEVIVEARSAEEAENLANNGEGKLQPDFSSFGSDCFTADETMNAEEI